MRSLSGVGVRSVRRSLGRYVLTAVGASLGVAVFFGVVVTNGSIDAALDRVVGSSTARAVSIDPVGTYGAELPDDVVDRAAALPGVRSASGTVWFAVNRPGDADQLLVRGGRSAEGPAAREPPLELGQELRTLGVDPAPDADEISFTTQRAASLGVGLGDTIDVVTPAGPVGLKVVRLVEDFDDDYGFTSIETARRLAGRGGYQHVYVSLSADTSAAQWSAEHAPVFGPSARLQVNAGGDFRSAMAVIQSAFSGLAILGAFVGGFLIFLTLSTMVIERTSTWGILRAVGASRRGVVRAVLGEAVVIGLVATVVGLGVGLVLATALLEFTSRLYGLGASRVTVSAGSVVAGVAMGMLVPPLAAYLPARRAARAEPVDAMRSRHQEAGTIGRGWIAGILIFAVGLLVARRAGTTAVQGAPLLLLLGAVLIAPALVQPVGRLAGPLVARLAPGVGTAALHHLLRERKRSGYTLALVMVIAAMVVAVGGVQGSIVDALHEGFRIRYRSDVTVSRYNGIDEDTLAAIRSAPGVGATTAYRFGQVALHAPVSRTVGLIAIDPASFFAIQDLPWSGTTAADGRAALARGDIVIPQIFAEQTGLGRGDEVTLPSAGGLPQTLRVGAVYTTPEPGVRLILAEAAAAAVIGPGQPLAVEVKAAPGTSPEALAAAIRTATAMRGGLQITTTAAREADAARRVEQNFRPFLAVVLLAGIVGVLGLANTLAMSVIRRTRELGVLRAVGIGRRDLARMVLVESASLAVIALGLGLPLGQLLSSTLLRATASSLGFTVGISVPWGLLPVVIVTTLVMAVVAAVAPARRAARLDPVVALRFE